MPVAAESTSSFRLPLRPRSQSATMVFDLRTSRCLSSLARVTTAVRIDLRLDQMTVVGICHTYLIWYPNRRGLPAVRSSLVPTTITCHRRTLRSLQHPIAREAGQLITARTSKCSSINISSNISGTAMRIACRVQHSRALFRHCEPFLNIWETRPWRNYRLL